MDEPKRPIRRILKIPSGFFNSGMKFSVRLVGAGGTGSHILQGLVRIHFALGELGLNGLQVIVSDDDQVEPHNLVRQHFSPSHVHMNKAEALIHEVNTKYGLDWLAFPEQCTSNIAIKCNFLITATDSGFFRNDVHKAIRSQKSNPHEEHASMMKLLAWIDCGNGKKSGQVIITDGRLPTPIDLNEGFFTFDRLPGSCSAQESLKTQDLFVNQATALYALDSFWKLLHDRYIDHHAVWFNLDTGKTTRSKIASLGQKAIGN